MGTLVRWTQLSDRIRPGTQDAAPTNFGTPDTLAEGVWVPYRREALVAEAENEGHDFGSYPLMGPWYVARALEGPGARPAWSSLLQWYWFARRSHARPLRDAILLLGSGATGMGTGMLVTTMNDQQLALHRKLVDRWRRLGAAAVALAMPGQGGVAVLHSFTQEAMDPYNEEQFYAAHAAWYDLLRAHIPAAVVSEETIAKDGLLRRFQAVLLPYIHCPLPAATMAGLERFRRAGGEVWVDLGTRLRVPDAQLVRTRYRPFWVQDAYYSMHAGYGVGAYDGNYEYWRMRQGSDQRLPAVRAAFGHLARGPVTSPDADVFMQERRGGEAVYVFASNDYFPKEPLAKTYLAYDTPRPAVVDFQFRGPVVYDALAMRPLDGLETRGGSLKVEFTDAEPARIWAVLPQPIRGVAVQVSGAEERLTVTAQVQGPAGKAIPAVIPLELTVRDGQGRKQYHLWRSTDGTGTCRVQVPVGWLAPAGRWSVAVRELLSGQAAPVVRIAVGARPPAALRQDAAAALVWDRPRIVDWLREIRGQEIWVALDRGQDDLHPQAASLARALAARGIHARVVHIADVPAIRLALGYRMSEGEEAAWRRVRDGQAVGLRQSSDLFREPGPERVVMRPLILLGDPKQNRWLADIHRFYLTRRRLSPGYPGPGRALVQYVWAPFYDGFDGVTITASDAEGVRAGIQELVNALR
jgi:hypothetical protein